MSATTRAQPAPRSRWRALIWAIPVALVVMAIVVLAARYVRDLPSVQSFMTTYPGESALPATATPGFPAWVEWQHALNSFFVLLILKSGWQIRSKKRPPAFWIRRNHGPIRTVNPPVRLGISTWLHLAIDILFVLNGVLFYVLLFCTNQWTRVVPVHWDVFPNAVSTGIQYASLNWPTNDGWANYNALQLLSYFVTIFIAGPIAILTGVRMMPGLAYRLRGLDRVFPLAVARAAHVVVMVYFVAFIVVHVTLVLSTGALRNLNHMYAGRDDQTWFGFAIFAATVVLMIVLWLAARPTVVGKFAELTGKVRYSQGR
jgi:thiosulfate reductase cytochrome b subunit